jgi:arylformamidase
MTVYRNFDQDTLDLEYRIRDSIPLPEFEAIIARYGTDSATARDGLDCRLDVAYGDHSDEVVDIFPAGEGAPVMVWVHGGYWRMMSQKESASMAPGLVAAGVALVTVNYSLAPGASLDEIVRQCRSALAWTHANARDFGGDPDRIYVSGSSAGGHLTGMLLAGGWHRDFGVPEDAVKGACALSGLYDLEPVRLSEVNEWAKLDATAAQRNSPIHHLPTSGCPLIVSYGGNETAEFKRQTDDYAAAWRAKGFDCRYVASPDHSHFDIIFQLDQRDTPLGAALFDLIGV